MLQSVKKKNSDKRREVSRDAARMRRNNETDIFLELQDCVPIVAEPKICHVDRIALLRLSASFIRFRQLAKKVLAPQSVNSNVDESALLSELFNESDLNNFFNGFLLVVDSRASIIYTSPNVSLTLGLTQTDLVGHRIYEFLKDEDVLELKEIFVKCKTDQQCKTFLRMKSVLGARGRNLNLRSALYKTVAVSVARRQVRRDVSVFRRSSSLANSPGDRSIVDDANGDCCDGGATLTSKSPSIDEVDAAYRRQRQRQRQRRLRRRHTASGDASMAQRRHGTFCDVVDDAIVPKYRDGDDFVAKRRKYDDGRARVTERWATSDELSDNTALSGPTVGEAPMKRGFDADRRVGSYFFVHVSAVGQYGCSGVDSQQQMNVFVTRHAMDMKITYCNEKLSHYLGYDKTLTNLSFFSLVHPQDLARLKLDFKQLYSKHQMTTGAYRLMVESGGYIWLTTEASVVVQGNRSGRGQNIICVHHVISGSHGKELLSDVQVELSLLTSQRNRQQQTCLPFSRFSLQSLSPTCPSVGAPPIKCEATAPSLVPAPACFPGDQTQTPDDARQGPLSSIYRAPDGTASVPIFDHEDTPVDCSYGRWLFRGESFAAQEYLLSNTLAIPPQLHSPALSPSASSSTSSAPSATIADLANCSNGTNSCGSTGSSGLSGLSPTFSPPDVVQRHTDDVAAYLQSIDRVEFLSPPNYATSVGFQKSFAHASNGFSQPFRNFGTSRPVDDVTNSLPRSTEQVAAYLRSNDDITGASTFPPSSLDDVIEHLSVDRCVSADGAALGRAAGGSAATAPGFRATVESSSFDKIGAQSSANGNLFAPVPCARAASSRKILNENLDDLAALAPFVDTGEVVNLDFGADNVDIPLDLTDFADCYLFPPGSPEEAGLWEDFFDDICFDLMSSSPQKKKPCKGSKDPSLPMYDQSENQRPSDQQRVDYTLPPSYYYPTDICYINVPPVSTPSSYAAHPPSHAHDILTPDEWPFSDALRKHYTENYLSPDYYPPYASDGWMRPACDDSSANQETTTPIDQHRAETGCNNQEYSSPIASKDAPFLFAACKEETADDVHCSSAPFLDYASTVLHSPPVSDHHFSSDYCSFDVSLNSTQNMGAAAGRLFDTNYDDDEFFADVKTPSKCRFDAAELFDSQSLDDVTFFEMQRNFFGDVVDSGVVVDGDFYAVHANPSPTPPSSSHDPSSMPTSPSASRRPSRPTTASSASATFALGDDDELPPDVASCLTVPPPGGFNVGGFVTDLDLSTTYITASNPVGYKASIRAAIDDAGHGYARNKAPLSLTSAEGYRAAAASLKRPRSKLDADGLSLTHDLTLTDSNRQTAIDRNHRIITTPSDQTNWSLTDRNGLHEPRKNRVETVKIEPSNNGNINTATDKNFSTEADRFATNFKRTTTGCQSFLENENMTDNKDAPATFTDSYPSQRTLNRKRSFLANLNGHGMQIRENEKNPLSLGVSVMPSKPSLRHQSDSTNQNGNLLTTGLGGLTVMAGIASYPSGTNQRSNVPTVRQKTVPAGIRASTRLVTHGSAPASSSSHGSGYGFASVNKYVGGYGCGTVNAKTVSRPVSGTMNVGFDGRSTYRALVGDRVRNDPSDSALFRTNGITTQAANKRWFADRLAPELAEPYRTPSTVKLSSPDSFGTASTSFPRKTVQYRQVIEPQPRKSVTYRVSATTELTRTAPYCAPKTVSYRSLEPAPKTARIQSWKNGSTYSNPNSNYSNPSSTRPVQQIIVRPTCTNGEPALKMKRLNDGNVFVNFMSLNNGPNINKANNRTVAAV